MSGLIRESRRESCSIEAILADYSSARPGAASDAVLARAQGLVSWRWRWRSCLRSCSRVDEIMLAVARRRRHSGGERVSVLVIVLSSSGVQVVRRPSEFLFCGEQLVSFTSRRDGLIRSYAQRSITQRDCVLVVLGLPGA